MANLWTKFKSLIPEEPLIIGTVSSINADGTSTITTFTGGTMRVKGQSVPVGAKAFVRFGEITAAAPNLPVTVVDI